MSTMAAASGEGGSGPPPQPPALALVAASALVTRYRLRLVDPGDQRLGPLGGAEYRLGVASWTGRVASFVGFYEPPATGALEDCERRVRAAEAWAHERLRLQAVGGAERCAVLLVALGALPEGRLAPRPRDSAVRIGVAGIDPATGAVTTPASLPPGLPGTRELRSFWRGAQNPAQVPTLAAVDLAERQTVAGGFAAPAARQLDVPPEATYGLIAAFGAVYLLETVLINHFSTPFGTDYLALYDAVGQAANTGPTASDWWRWVSNAFVHSAGFGGLGPLHVIGNAFGILVLGRPIERLYGRLALIVTFLLTAVGGSLFWLLCGQIGLAGSGYAIGASGGVFGLIGLTLMIGRVQGRDLPAGLTAALRQYATGLLLYNAIFLVIFSRAYGINNFAHAGGLLTGILVGLWLPPRASVGGRDQRMWERLVLAAVVVAAAVAMLFAGHHLDAVLSAPSALAPSPIG